MSRRFCVPWFVAGAVLGVLGCRSANSIVRGSDSIHAATAPDALAAPNSARTGDFRRKHVTPDGVESAHGLARRRDHTTGVLRFEVAAAAILRRWLTPLSDVCVVTHC